MPQVQLNTRVEVETFIRLKRYSGESGESMAAIVDVAVNEYLDKIGYKKKESDA